MGCLSFGLLVGSSQWLEMKGKGELDYYIAECSMCQAEKFGFDSLSSGRLSKIFSTGGR